MHNEKELFDLIKETYLQNPTEDFVSSTESKLRQKSTKNE